tara:strand:- start:399 stop:1091 length:693 start_codon:yes stop_codon:yes gene_type:complete
MKIEVFIRHCYYSDLKYSTQNRPEWWDKEKVFKNFKRTLNFETTNYTIVYDKHYGNRSETFLKDEENVYEIDCGKESLSFIETLNYSLSKDFDDDTIIYFLEDDYVHRPDWDKILIDGFNLPVDYVTLYDHGDKYQEMYEDLMTKVHHTELSHWIPTPSTTNTFAVKFKTIKEDQNIHRYFSTSFEPSADHNKFLELHQKKRILISSLPGYSTHAHKEFLSPCIDWSQYL